MGKDTSWESTEQSYGKLVGEKGHYYHQSLILPNVLRILDCKKSKKIALLDIGCGSGVLARHLPNEVDYTGVDLSQGLLDQAKKITKTGSFYYGDATKPLPLKKVDFDVAIFILSLQNMEQGNEAIIQVAKHIKGGGKILLILNHPSFRIPRQTDWGYDEGKKMIYRIVNSYMGTLKIPIAMEPSKKEKSPMTYSFHHPLSTYVSWLVTAGFSITGMEEWCSDKKSEGSRAKAEDRARKEIPLFLSLLAIKG